MTPFLIKPASKIRGEFLVHPDKSITHRAVILAALSQGLTKIKNFSKSLDCFYTLRIFKQLGAKVQKNKNNLFIKGCGLSKPKKPLFCGESGTTIRLLLGVLVGQDFQSCLIAAPSLNKRPMARVIKPLEAMGARISATKRGGSAKNFGGSAKKLEYYPPITIKPSNLHGIKYELEVPSAQVKSAILLAALYAQGKTEIIEPIVSRDHTERMLGLFGANIRVGSKNSINKPRRISINSTKDLVSPGEIVIPGDFSSAVFFIAAALLVSNSRLILKSVGLNPTRIGALNVLIRMKANIKIKNYRVRSGEPQGDIIVSSVGAHRDVPLLLATKINRQEVPFLIDELPILMVASSQAKGQTIIEGVEELRVKETDRINSMVTNLKAMGAKISVKRKAKSAKQKNEETIIIDGPTKLKGAALKSFGDHRTAMSMCIAGLVAEGNSVLDDISCTKKSFPEFKELFLGLTQA